MLGTLAGCNGLRVPLERELPGDWAQDGGNAGRNSASEIALLLPLEQHWRTGVEAAFGTASALVLGDMIAVGTRRGEVVLIAAENGRRLGRVEVGEAIEGGLARAADVIYTPVDKGRRGIQALEPATGARQDLARSATAASVLVLPNGLAVATTERNTVGAFRADATAAQWTQEIGPGRIVAGAAGNGDVVVVGDDGGTLVALDPETGVVRWRRALGVPVLERPALGSLLYVSTPRGRLLALDPASGAERWRLSLPDTTVRLAAPAVSGDDLAVAGTDGRVRLLDARTGAVRWEAVLDGAITAAPMVTAGHVFVGTHRKRLVALDRASGANVWEDELRGRVKSAMAIGAGCLVVLTDARDVLCYRPATPAAATSARR